MFHCFLPTCSNIITCWLVVMFWNLVLAINEFLLDGKGMAFEVHVYVILKNVERKRTSP